MKREVVEPEHIKRRKQRNRDGDTENDRIDFKSSSDNLVFGEKSGQWHDTRNGQATYEEGEVCGRKVLFQSAHRTYVLLAAHSVNHRAAAEEEEGLETCVGYYVKYSNAVRPESQRDKHEAQLGDR